MSDRHRYLPYPELVESEPGTSPYRIHDSTTEPGRNTGSVDKVNRHLHVPLRRDGRPVSRHELAHVHWSPRRLPRVRFHLAVLHAVEDARINLGLAAVSLPVVLDAEQRTHVRLLGLRDLKDGRAADFALRWVASLGTSADAELASVAGGGEPGAAAAERLVERVRTRLERERRGAVAPFRAGLEAARELAKALRARGHLDPAFREIHLEIGCCEESPAAAAAARRRSRRGLLRGRGRTRGDRDAHGVEPGEMRVVEAPLDLPHAAARRGLRRAWRPATEGARLGRLHRFCLDRAVFRRPLRRWGGSVLIDTSGSMRLDSEGIDAILAATRGVALVAIYSGRDAEGELRVVARGGSRAAPDQLEPFGGGNIVDLPALGWLARQPQPRIWVSDGGVTGVGDNASPEHTQRCADARRAGRIRRVGSAEAAADLLAGRRS